MIAEGTPREAMTGAVLSRAYECEIAVDTVSARGGGPLILPLTSGRWRAGNASGSV
jgi:hypothetical protein